MNRMLVPVLCGVFVLGSAPGADWPQWMGPDRDATWTETDILDKFPKGGPKRLWRTKIHGGFTGPAVVGGLVYVMDYVTDADTAKLSDPDTRPNVKGKERILCLSAKDGTEVWKHEYDCDYRISYPAGPRCTPTVHAGRVYALGAMGDLFCLDAKKGTVLWHKDFKKAPYEAKVPTWGYTGHPLVDGDHLVCLVGGKRGALVAFQRETGKEVWAALKGDGETLGYCPPSLVVAGGKRQLLLWLPEEINSVDPAKGEKYWSVKLKVNYDMSIVAPRKSGDYLFAGGIGGRSVMLKMSREKPVVEEVWRTEKWGTVGLGPVNSTPFMEKDTMYGVDQPGQLRAVDLATGKHLWETFRPTTGKGKASSGTAFLVRNGERYFVFAETGELVIAKLSREKYEEIDRAKLLEPTGTAFGRAVVWSHPAFAERCVFARNDKEIVCYSLAKD